MMRSAFSSSVTKNVVVMNRRGTKDLVSNRAGNQNLFSEFSKSNRWVSAVALCNNHCFSTSSSSSEQHYDVLIVGGGVVGCSLARLLNEKVPTLSVGLIEARQGPPPASSKNKGEVPTIPHPRSYALSPKSLNILGRTTVENIVDRSGYYNSMQVWESSNPASLIFTSQDMKDQQDQIVQDQKDYLGAVVEDSTLVQSLWYQLMDRGVKCYTNTTLDKIQLPSSSSSSSQFTADSGSNSSSVVTVETNNNEVITTSLLVGADGGNSPIRNNVLDTSMISYQYEKQALTFTVKLNPRVNRKSLYDQRAYQRFLSGEINDEEGIIALLPTYDNNYGIIVWSTTPEIVSKYKNHPNTNNEVVTKLQSIFQQGPQRLPPLFEHPTSSSSSFVDNFLSGCERIVDTVQYGVTMVGQTGTVNSSPYIAPPDIIEIVSSRLSFPLSCRHVQSYIGPRVALVGDAAHTVHPMAGQGLNIGLQDVQALVDIIQSKEQVGMDIGDTFCLQQYNDNRMKQVTATLLGIHTLHEMFNTKTVPMKHLKSLGMNMVQNVQPLRKQFVQAATYGVAF